MSAGSSLLGLAAGDCLGVAVEGWPAERIVEAFGVVTEPHSEHTRWSDDTQQAIVLSECVVRHGWLDPMWIGDRLVEMRDEPGGSLHRGTGRGFRSSIDRYADERDPARSGATDRAGNGGAMRIAPAAVAISARGIDDDEFTEQIIGATLITHREIRGIAGALAAAWAARLIGGAGYPLEDDVGRELLGEIVARTREGEAQADPRLEQTSETDPWDIHAVSAALEIALASWPNGWDAMEKQIARNASTAIGTRISAGEGFVLSSVVTAVALSCRSSEPLARTLSTVVGIGGDTDTTAAIVGGIAGAAAGIDAVPTAWRQRIVAWGELERLADALDATGEVGIASLPDFMAVERAIGADAHR
jgi:ADP-ribosylglycohydrolase